MRKLTIILYVIMMVSVCLGTTVYLRKGGTVEGEVISKDDEKFVIKAAEGEKTLKWRQLTNKSIKEIHPELYEALKAKALERKKEKEKLEKPVKEKESPNHPISLLVKTRKTRGHFEKIDTKEILDNMKPSRKREWKSLKILKKERVREINIKISGLNPKKEFVLKTVYSHYLKTFGDSGMFFKEAVSEKNVEKKNSLSGEENYELKITTSPYYQYRDRLVSSEYHFKSGEGNKREYGAKSDGVDVSIWLDNILVYEKKNGKPQTYYNGATNIFKR